MMEFIAIKKVIGFWPSMWPVRLFSELNNRNQFEL